MTNDCTYKDSGIEWIGEIPQDWDIVQVKNLFNIGRGRVISQLELDDNGEYPVYSSQTQNNGCLGYIKTYDFDISQLTWTTDGANAGTVFLREGKHNCTNVCGTLQPKNNNINLKYMLYNLVHTAHYHKRQDTNGYKIMNNEMAAIKLCVPKLSEQQQIADYLDNKCSGIDEVIETEKSVIEKLKDYKQSIITEAVTKGLDKSVPLKDSGIEWIGKIPQHWEIKRTKYTANSFEKGNGITKEDVVEDGDIQCIRYGEIYSKYDRQCVESVSATNLDKISSPKHILKGDILFAGTGELIEEIGKNIVYMGDKPCLAGGDIIILNHNQNPVFLNYALNSVYSQAQKSYGKVKLKVVHISASAIGDIRIAIPPIEEQEQIAEYLDKKCSEIDKAIADKEQVIEKFTEYKKSLIYECVTGKKRVV